MDKYSEFEVKLELFIDKYYKMSIIKGIILFIVLTSTIILAISYFEFLGWFNYSGRLFLFLFGIVSSLFILNYFFIIPILRYFGLLNRLTKKRTEEILHENLPDIKDYVLNVLELKELHRLEQANDLITASINQKIEYTAGFDFRSIITIKSLYPLFKYLFSIALLYALIFILKPAIISEGSNRIIHFQREFVKSVGYTIHIVDSNLVVEKGQNLDFSVKIEGENIPEFVSYFIGNNEYLMKKIDNRNYSSSIKSINNSFAFRVGNDQFKTNLYQVTVIQPPFLNDFSISLAYPPYTHKTNEKLNKITNFKVPVGSKIKWEFDCLNVNELRIKVDTISKVFFTSGKLFYFDTTIYSSQYYSIYGFNDNLTRELVSKSFITVIPDLFPEISVIQVFDESNKKLLHFKGHIFDDYGFKNLCFIINSQKIFLPFNSSLNKQDFFFSYEFSEVGESEFSYYFEVFDNDAINGSKSSKSNIFNFKIPDYTELANFKKNQDKEVFEKMEKSLLLAEEFKRDIENIKEKLYSEKLSSFEKQQLIEGLQNKQNMLEQIMNDFAKQNFNKNKQFDSFNEQNVELLKKQDEIQKMLESVMTDELKALLDELKKLSQEFNNTELNKQLDKLEMNYNQLSEQLDKNMELLKKYEVEKNLDNISQQLAIISENQKNLANEKFTKAISDSLGRLDKSKIEKLEEQYKKAFDSNNELDNPMNLQNLEKEFDDLNLNMKPAEQNDKSSEKEQKARFSENSKKTKELSDKIQDMINNNRVDENGENSEALRQVLENLIYFSFTQESINESFNISSINSLVYIDNVKSQINLLDNYSIIKDSLLAISKRTPELGNHISKKVYSIENALYIVQSNLNESNLAGARLEQRKVLEVSNELILLLSESLKNMEMSGEGVGGSSNKKNKPKQSKPSLSDMRKSQEGMKSQLEGMIQKMKEGKGQNGKPSSEQIGKMLAQQEIFQQMMNQLQNGSGVGQDIQKKLSEISQLLEQNKRDLIRSNIDQATLFRQNQIVTRLLEAEKSEMERELDDKRKSIEAEKYVISKPSELFELEKGKVNFNDILNSNSLKLNYFYKNKYQEYLMNLN